MKLQSLEASLPALRAHLPCSLPPGQQEPLGLRGFLSRKEAREVERGAHARLSPGKSWSGAPGGQVEGAPVSGRQLETVAWRSQPSCLCSLVCRVTCDSALVC